MSDSKLTQLLRLFEGTRSAHTIGDIAQQLDVSAERADSMIQFWVKKGEIREASELQDCGSCGINGSCPFVVKMPRTYELSSRDDWENPVDVKSTCEINR